MWTFYSICILHYTDTHTPVTRTAKMSSATADQMREPPRKGDPGPRAGAGLGSNRRRLPPRCWVTFRRRASPPPAAWPVAGSGRRDNNSAVRSGDRQTPTPPAPQDTCRAPHAARPSRRAGPRRPVVPLYGCQAQLLEAVRALSSSLGSRLSGLTAWDGRTDGTGLFRGGAALAPAVL